MAVREGLLALLDDGKRHWLPAEDRVRARHRRRLQPLNVGQVYTTLERLERDGLVAVAEENGQKSYELTAAVGKARSVVGAVPVDDPPPRDELMLKMLMAIEHGPEHALAVLTCHRTALVALLNCAAARNATTLPAEAAPASALVADALVVRAEADLPCSISANPASRIERQ